MSHASEEPRPSSSLIWPTLLAALIGLAGSIYLSVGMNLKACPLCFYQRTFMMGVVAILIVGLLSNRRYGGILNLLALPMAVAGFGVAVFHVNLEVVGKLECPKGILGLGTAPQQSLASYLLLLAAVAFGLKRDRQAGQINLVATAVAIVLGVLLAAASIWSAPPMPTAPTKPHDAPFDTCRAPYRAAS